VVDRKDFFGARLAFMGLSMNWLARGWQRVSPSELSVLTSTCAHWKRTFRYYHTVVWGTGPSIAERAKRRERRDATRSAELPCPSHRAVKLGPDISARDD
jgi:hypothetical protein